MNGVTTANQRGRSLIHRAAPPLNVCIVLALPRVLIGCFVCQVGDGTTSVTLLAAEFLKQVKPYVEEGLHPQVIIRAFRTATQLVST